MEKKKIKMQCYRYHLSPITTQQVDMFSVKKSNQELIAEKNKLFKESLEGTIKFENRKGKELTHRVLTTDEDMLLLELANKKSLKFFKDWNQNEIETAPFIILAFWNSPDKQYLVIQHNSNVFSNTDTVSKLLSKSLNQYLRQSYLQIEIFPLIDEKSFWGMLSKYEKRIYQLSFDIVFNISYARSRFREDFKKLSTQTNSVKSKVELNAPEQGVLENLNKNNQELAQLGELTQDGMSGISLRARGVKGKITSKDSTKEFEIEEINGKDSKDVTKIISNLFKRLE